MALASPHLVSPPASDPGLGLPLGPEPIDCGFSFLAGHVCMVSDQNKADMETLRGIIIQPEPA